MAPVQASGRSSCFRPGVGWQGHEGRSNARCSSPVDHLVVAADWPPRPNHGQDRSAWTDPLDANCRRVRRLADLGSLSMVSALVDASGCTSLLLYFLLYGLDG